jgi:hypothetical protein
VLANGDIEADLDEVIDLRAALNPGAAESGTVDGGVLTDLDIIIDLHGSGLRDFLLFPIAELIAKAIGTHHDSAVKDDSIADAATLTNCDMWVKVASFAKYALLPDKALGLNHTPSINLNSCFNNHMGADRTSLADFRIWRDDCCGVDAWFPNDGLRGEKGQDFCKGGCWVGDEKTMGWDFFRERIRQENSCCTGLSQRIDVFRVSEKRDVAWIGISQRGDIGDFDIPCFRS